MNGQEITADRGKAYYCKVFDASCEKVSREQLLSALGVGIASLAEPDNCFDIENFFRDEEWGDAPLKLFQDSLYEMVDLVKDRLPTEDLIEFILRFAFYYRMSESFGMCLMAKCDEADHLKKSREMEDMVTGLGEQLKIALDLIDRNKIALAENLSDERSRENGEET